MTTMVPHRRVENESWNIAKARLVEILDGFLSGDAYVEDDPRGEYGV